ncbi:hypothetical protein BU16DRAFT_534265 [Lophium mytilinum]|uniref:Fungal N-terminal domain-containing protein n=1 Tax=Lophium mytilinum TaxID=390894 RepID=A0A6A6RAN4_9PEZI|nr:hypothetical protein BU16DRAFT_534265 [Lophium mytilinum]
MVTGAETVGLTLAAILPLFIEAAKAYGKGVDTIRDDTSSRRRDDRLQEFFDDFWWELKSFDQQVRTLVRGLPHLCNECKRELEKDMSSLSASGGWEKDEEVARALSHSFGTSLQHKSFVLITSRILRLLAWLIGDKTLHLYGIETVSRESTSFMSLRDFCAYCQYRHVRGRACCEEYGWLLYKLSESDKSTSGH